MERRVSNSYSDSAFARMARMSEEDICDLGGGASAAMPTPAATEVEVVAVQKWTSAGRKIGFMCDCGINNVLNRLSRRPCAI